MVGASVGSMGFVTSHVLPSLQNQNMWNIRSKNPKFQLFLKHIVKKIVKENIGSASGSARDFFRKDYFKTINFVQPSGKILHNFNDIVLPIYLKIDQNIKEIETLSEIRDLLLPKLMSGQIRVPLVKV